MPSLPTGLNLIQLKEDLKRAAIQARGLEDVDEALNLYAERVAEAIDRFVRTGLVITSGTATDQTGQIT